MLFYSTRSLVLVIGGKRGRGGNILVQAGRLRRPKVVIHVWCVFRALQRTQNTPNVYKRNIFGAEILISSWLPALSAHQSTTSLEKRVVRVPVVRYYV